MPSVMEEIKLDKDDLGETKALIENLPFLLFKQYFCSEWLGQHWAAFDSNMVQWVCQTYTVKGMHCGKLKTTERNKAASVLFKLSYHN